MMFHRMICTAPVLAFLILASAVGMRAAQDAPEAASTRTGWKVPAGAEKEASPLTVNDTVLTAGRKLFMSKCQRCHGTEGKGDGIDAEARRQRSMDLTLATRAAANPDGVIFYKVWNGRTSPKMPIFSEELSRDQVWTIIAFVQTLRAKE